MGYLDNKHERLRVLVRYYLDDAIYSRLNGQVGALLSGDLLDRIGRPLHRMFADQLEQQTRLRLQKDLHATFRLYTPVSSRRISKVR